jgi:hypothetical protein
MMNVTAQVMSHENRFLQYKPDYTQVAWLRYCVMASKTYRGGVQTRVARLVS